MDIFLDTESTKEAVIKAGAAIILQYIYCGPGIRHWWNTMQHVLKEGSGRTDPNWNSNSNRWCSCTAFTPCLPTDPGWTLLQSMSVSSCDYGWTLGVHGYESIPTLYPMAPDELMKFANCNCQRDCSDWRYSCQKSGVTCIWACGVCSARPYMQKLH